MDKLRAIIENHDTNLGRAFDLFIQSLILLSIASFTVETLPGLSEQQLRILRLINIGTVSIFTLEYLLRIVVSRSRRKFVFSFYGLVDLVAILPFYIASGIDLRSLRIFRLFRLLRILKVLRFNAAIMRFKIAFRSIKNELAVFASATGFMLYVAAVGIYYFENQAQPEQFKSVFHALWWAVTTLTTVGYGDAYPVTVGGRIFTFVVLMIGLGVVAIPTGLISSALSATISAEKVESQASKGTEP
jgi:voltage-gated potassium channel